MKPNWLALTCSKASALLLILFLQTPTASAGENIALGAPYVLSPQPLYELTRDEGDSNQLTDGKLATGTMWTSRLSVGWNVTPQPIVAEIDLGTEKPIGKICLRSARRQSAGVSFPQRIDFFLSNDRAAYAWAGRIQPYSEFGDGDYLAREFCSAPDSHSARFVRINIQARGGYFFSDEISVTSRDDAQNQALIAPIEAAEISDFIVEHEAISKITNALVERYSATLAGNSALDRMRKIKGDLVSPDESTSVNRLAEITEDIRSIVREARAQSGKAVNITVADPWRLATPFDGAISSSLPAPLHIAAGGHGVFSFAIEHAMERSTPFRISALVAGASTSAVTAIPYEVAMVTRADGQRMGDPLLPLRGDELMVPVGETRQLWIDVKAADMRQVRDASITLQVETELPTGPFSQSFNLPVKIVPTPAIEPQPSIPAWGYLHDLPIRRQPDEAVRDMLSHGVNTAVVPAWHSLPWPKASAKPDQSEIGDYRAYDQVMGALKGHRQYLFFLAFNSEPRIGRLNTVHPFLSDEWKALFVAWIREWSAKLRADGLGYQQFAFYPVDEPHPGPERDTLVEVAKLIRQADPKLRIYTTLHDEKYLSEPLVNAVDIFQLNGLALVNRLIVGLRERGKEVWSYQTDGGGKAGDPATFYRATAWDAYVRGLTGFGFWAYADAGVKGLAWNDIDDVRPDFSVVYELNDGFVSSKRWEAWREGVQDFGLLRAAAHAARDRITRQRVEELARIGLREISDGSRLADVRRRLFDIVQNGFERVESR